MICAAWACYARPVRANEDYDFYKKYGHHQKNWDEAVEAGFTAYEAGDCEGALSHLKQAIGAQCQDALVYFKMAVCTELTGSPYSAMQYYQLAQEKLEKLSGLHRYQKEIFENYGRALFKAKRYEDALPYLSRAAAVGTPSFGLYYMVGYLYAQKKDWTAALDYFRKAVAQDTSEVSPPLLSRVYLELARVHFNQKEYDQAVPLLNQAVQLDPNNQEAALLKSQTNQALQQKNMVQMIETLTDRALSEAKPGEKSAPPPPAAQKLPPLETAPQRTPAQGSTTTQETGKLAPLPVP